MLTKQVGTAAVLAEARLDAKAWAKPAPAVADAEAAVVFGGWGVGGHGQPVSCMQAEPRRSHGSHPRTAATSEQQPPPNSSQRNVRRKFLTGNSLRRGIAAVGPGLGNCTRGGHSNSAAAGGACTGVGACDDLSGSLGVGADGLSQTCSVGICHSIGAEGLSHHRDKRLCPAARSDGRAMALAAACRPGEAGRRVGGSRVLPARLTVLQHDSQQAI